MTVVGRIQQLREMAKLSPRDLEKLSGLKRSHIWAIEHRGTDPEVSTLKAIALVLGATVGWLANGEGRAPTVKDVQKAVESARKRMSAENQAGS